MCVCVGVCLNTEYKQIGFLNRYDKRSVLVCLHVCVGGNNLFCTLCEINDVFVHVGVSFRDNAMTISRVLGRGVHLFIYECECVCVER